MGAVHATNRVEELLGQVFGVSPHALRSVVAHWLTVSRRFYAFVAENHLKIRKKVRLASDVDSQSDLRLELETAFLLLQERSLSVVYEPVPPDQGRGPDFAVRFTTAQTFLVEVTRLRGTPQDGPSASADRIAEAVCAKLGQLAPSCSNVLLVGRDGGAPSPTSDELRAAMLRLQQRVEASDPAVLQRLRVSDRAVFFRQYLRLSEVLVRTSTGDGGEDAMVFWVNPQAKHPLPAKVQTVLYRSQTPLSQAQAGTYGTLGKTITSSE
jgi:hypothetical protein